MEKEAQKPQIAPPRIRNIDEVLRELRGNQAHLPTHMVSLTVERYTSSKAKERVKNIATLMDVAMDKDFLERCLNAKIHSFYISSKNMPRETIDALENPDLDNPFLCFKIDRGKRTLNPISNDEFNMLNPNERGKLHRSVLEEIREGGILRIDFSGTIWWVNYPAYHVGKVSLPTAFVDSTD